MLDSRIAARAGEADRERRRHASALAQALALGVVLICWAGPRAQGPGAALAAEGPVELRLARREQVRAPRGVSDAVRRGDSSARRGALLETVRVPANQREKVQAKTVLERGRLYLLEASGTYTVWRQPKDAVDAVWCFHPKPCGPNPKAWNQLRIDGQSLSAVDAARRGQKAPLAYRDDHVYSVWYRGAGKAPQLWITDALNSWSDNSGALTLRIFAADGAEAGAARGVAGAAASATGVAAGPAGVASSVATGLAAGPGVTSSVATGVAAGPGVASRVATGVRPSAIDERLTQLVERIARETSRVRDYLSRYDQVLRMETVLGQRSIGDANGQLAQRARELYRHSFSDSDLEPLIELHRKTATAYLDAIGRAVESSRTWPDPEAAGAYRDLARSLLEELRAEYADTVRRGLDPLVVLVDAAEIMGWSQGRRELQASDNPFDGSRERVIAAIPSRERQHALALADRDRPRELDEPRPKPVPIVAVGAGATQVGSAGPGTLPPDLPGPPRARARSLPAVPDDLSPLTRSELETWLAGLRERVEAETSRVRRYLVHFDQLLRIRVALGAMSGEDANARLMSRGRALYDTSYSSGDFDQLLEHHRRHAAAYFADVERALRRAVDWPDPGNAQAYSTLALSLLAQLREEYEMQAERGHVSASVLADLVELRGWSDGQRSLPASLNPFAGQRQRVIAAIPNPSLRAMLAEAVPDDLDASAPRPKPAPSARASGSTGTSVASAVTGSAAPMTRSGLQPQREPAPARAATVLSQLSSAELEARLARLRAQVDTEVRRVSAYLALVDQIQRVQLVLGARRVADADAELATRGRSLYRRSFDRREYEQLLAEHQRTVLGYFEHVEQRLRDARVWPDAAAGAEYRALALRLLDELRREYRARITSGSNTAVLLADASELLAWTTGTRELSRTSNPFLGERARVIAAMPNAELQRRLEQSERSGADPAEPRPKPVPVAAGVPARAASSVAQTRPVPPPATRAPLVGAATSTDGTPASVSPAALTLEPDTERSGRDYRSFSLPEPRPELCQRACAQERQCLAFTYFEPGLQGPRARCWLKAGAPEARPAQGRISGIKVAAGRPAAGQTAASTSAALPQTGGETRGSDTTLPAPAAASALRARAPRLATRDSATQGVGAAVADTSTGAAAHAPSIVWSNTPGTFSLRGRDGERFHYRCPPLGGGRLGYVWGTDEFTDDSSICTAAVHGGVIDAERGGPVSIEIRPGRQSYQGSTRNGVSSSSYARWHGSFAFVTDAAAGGLAESDRAATVEPPSQPSAGTRPLPSETAAIGAPPASARTITWGNSPGTFSLRGRDGERFHYVCPSLAGGSFGSLWGTEVFTDDSSICTAAVHSGNIDAERGGRVSIEIRPGQQSYQGSTRNGVSSSSYGKWSGSFVLVAGSRPAGIAQASRAREAVNAETLGIEVLDTGVPVIGVASTGAAAHSGLQPGDLILAVDDQPVATPAELDHGIANHTDAAPIRLTVLRSGEPVALEVSSAAAQAVRAVSAVESGVDRAPRTDLLLHLNFLEAPDRGRVRDRSVYGRDGVIHGDAVWLAHKGLYLDGDDYVEVPAPDLHTGRAFTLAGDFVPLSFGAPLGYHEWHAIAWKGNTPDCTTGCENRSFSFWLHGSGYLHFASTPADRIGVGQLHVNTPARTVRGHTVFAAVIDGAEMRVYVDGELAARASYSSAGIRESSGPLTIGAVPAANWGGTGLSMYLRSLKVFDRALADDEIRALAAEAKRAPAKRITTKDVSYADRAIVRGPYAKVVPLDRIAKADHAARARIEPSIDVKNGSLAQVGDQGATELILYHDGTAARLSGISTVLDCVEHCGRAGSVEFEIIGDGVSRWSSGVIRQTDDPRAFDVDLSGITELRLVASDAGDGPRDDWAAWVNLSVRGASTTVTQASRVPVSGGPDSIRVAAATLGENCGARRGNVTLALSRACDGEQRCNFVVTQALMRAAAPDCENDLVAEWRCGSAPELVTVRTDAIDAGSSLTLSCGPSESVPRVGARGASVGDPGAAAYRRVPKSAIRGHNRKTLYEVSVQQCREACDEFGWCKSFDYYRDSRYCYLQPVDVEDVGAFRTDSTGQAFDYYEKPSR